jgi:hypothetical protein
VLHDLLSSKRGTARHAGDSDRQVLVLRKIECTSGNEMPCPDHVVIEVQSFCRKFGRADPEKEAVRIVEPCISTFFI